MLTSFRTNALKFYWSMNNIICIYWLFDFIFIPAESKCFRVKNQMSISEVNPSILIFHGRLSVSKSITSFLIKFFNKNYNKTSTSPELGEHSSSFSSDFIEDDEDVDEVLIRLFLSDPSIENLRPRTTLLNYLFLLFERENVLLKVSNNIDKFSVFNL